MDVYSLEADNLLTSQDAGDDTYIQENECNIDCDDAMKKVWLSWASENLQAVCAKLSCDTKIIAQKHRICKTPKMKLLKRSGTDMKCTQHNIRKININYVLENWSLIRLSIKRTIGLPGMMIAASIDTDYWSLH